MKKKGKARKITTTKKGTASKITNQKRGSATRHTMKKNGAATKNEKPLDPVLIKAKLKERIKLRKKR